jgi:hypothetical protein
VTRNELTYPQLIAAAAAPLIAFALLAFIDVPQKALAAALGVLAVGFALGSTGLMGAMRVALLAIAALFAATAVAFGVAAVVS